MDEEKRSNWFSLVGHTLLLQHLVFKHASGFEPHPVSQIICLHLLCCLLQFLCQFVHTNAFITSWFIKRTPTRFVIDNVVLYNHHHATPPNVLASHASKYYIHTHPPVRILFEQLKRLVIILVNMDVFYIINACMWLVNDSVLDTILLNTTRPVTLVVMAWFVCVV